VVLLADPVVAICAAVGVARAEKLTWRQNARIAGIGIMAAIKKALLLPKHVRRTVTPIRFKHSPVCS